MLEPYVAAKSEVYLRQTAYAILAISFYGPPSMKSSHVHLCQGLTENSSKWFKFAAAYWTGNARILVLTLSYKTYEYNGPLSTDHSTCNFCSKATAIVNLIITMIPAIKRLEINK